MIIINEIIGSEDDVRNVKIQVVDKRYVNIVFDLLSRTIKIGMSKTEAELLNTKLVKELKESEV